MMGIVNLSNISEDWNPEVIEDITIIGSVKQRPDSCISCKSRPTEDVDEHYPTQLNKPFWYHGRNHGQETLTVDPGSPSGQQAYRSKVLLHTSPAVESRAVKSMQEGLFISTMHQ